MKGYVYVIENIATGKTATFRSLEKLCKANGITSSTLRVHWWKYPEKETYTKKGLRVHKVYDPNRFPTVRHRRRLPHPVDEGQEREKIRLEIETTLKKKIAEGETWPKPFNKHLFPNKKTTKDVRKPFPGSKINTNKPQKEISQRAT